MSLLWKEAFTLGDFSWSNTNSFSDIIEITDLEALKHFLDAVHVKFCLLKPWCETENYPLVDSRDLLPSFEAELWEYKGLPGFSMVAFARPLESFSEIFQYDILHPVLSAVNTAEGASCPLETHVIARNVQMFLSRLPKKLQDPFRDQFRRVDTAVLDYYPALMPYLLAMDRAHVFATDVYGHYHLAGLFASFPSDMDGEIKRFGLRTGKFKIGDNEMYERNRTFVCQFLMELYGFPISSERRTSAALFSRRLHKLGERFLVRVLGQSDRTITTIWNNGENRPYPRVEKIALVKLDPEQKDLIRACEEGGFFVDAEKRVVIIRISYKQHRYNADNVRQDRALSVERQELIHPLTGRVMPDVNVVKDTSTMILRLNDIVRGEYVGRAVYKRNELVENTDTDENLRGIFDAMEALDAPVIYPVHPRNHARAERLCSQRAYRNLLLTQPMGYQTSISLVNRAEKIVTDSGGVQREAFFAKKPCVTVLDYVGWPETMVNGYNQLARPEKADILEKLSRPVTFDPAYQPFGDGHSAEKIVSEIRKFLQ